MGDGIAIQWKGQSCICIARLPTNNASCLTSKLPSRLLATQTACRSRPHYSSLPALSVTPVSRDRLYGLPRILSARLLAQLLSLHCKPLLLPM